MGINKDLLFRNFLPLFWFTWKYHLNSLTVSRFTFVNIFLAFYEGSNIGNARWLKIIIHPVKVVWISTYARETEVDRRWLSSGNGYFWLKSKSCKCIFHYLHCIVGNSLGCGEMPWNSKVRARLAFIHFPLVFHTKTWESVMCTSSGLHSSVMNARCDDILVSSRIEKSRSEHMRTSRRKKCLVLRHLLARFMFSRR